MQIPLKQISNILEDEDAVIAIEIFKKNKVRYVLKTKTIEGLKKSLKYIETCIKK